MDQNHVVIMAITLGATFIRFPINVWLAESEPELVYNKDDIASLKNMKLLFVWWGHPCKKNKVPKGIANLFFLIGPVSILILIFLGMIFHSL